MARASAGCQNLPMTDVTTATIPLNSGAAIPQVGLGVWQPRPARRRERRCWRRCASATATSTPRASTATKQTSAPAFARAACRASSCSSRPSSGTTTRATIARCAPSTPACSAWAWSYVDLYLLHWPVAGKRLDSWRALERLYEEKRARSIGVSNFLVPHLEELLGARQARPRRQSDRADAVPAAARHHRLLPAARHRRRGLQPAHPRAPAGSPGPGGGRPPRRADGRAGLAALERAARERRPAEVDQTGAHRRERSDLRLHPRRAGDGRARRAGGGAGHRLGSRGAGLRRPGERRAAAAEEQKPPVRSNSDSDRA